MSGFFWVIVVAMAAVAVLFIARPFRRGQTKQARLALTLGMLLPALAIGLYLSIGSPGLQEGQAQSSAAGRTAMSERGTTASRSVGSVASMVDGLAERLAQEPNDGKGWLLLARSYKHLNRTSDAVAAYAKAVALGETDAALTQLAMAPDSAAASSTKIHGKVSVSDAARDIILPEDTVFIFARAVDGPAMPVAVVQRPASALPIDFLLDDTQSMGMGPSLSDVHSVVVTARISRSGNASDALQGLEARSDIVDVGAAGNVELVIAPQN
jgi:hypothetical protein